jgi:uncharacterized membrane protein
MSQPTIIGWVGYGAGSSASPLNGLVATLVAIPIFDYYPFSVTVGINYAISYKASLGYTTGQVEMAIAAALLTYFNHGFYLKVPVTGVLGTVFSALFGAVLQSASVQLTDAFGNVLSGDYLLQPATQVSLGPISGTITFV